MGCHFVTRKTFPHFLEKINFHSLHWDSLLTISWFSSHFNFFPLLNVCFHWSLHITVVEKTLTFLRLVLPIQSFDLFSDFEVGKCFLVNWVKWVSSKSLNCSKSFLGWNIYFLCLFVWVCVCGCWWIWIPRMLMVASWININLWWLLLWFVKRLKIM